MLISLMAILVVAASTAVRDAIAEGPVVLEGPTTLELGLIGAGLLIIYVVASRRFSRRCERIATTDGVTAAEQGPPAGLAADQEPSRGAA